MSEAVVSYVFRWATGLSPAAKGDTGNMTRTQQIHCRHVSVIDDGEGGLQVVFEEERDQEDGPYVLLQRLFLEELDVGEDPKPIYLEMQDPDLCGHHR